MSFSARVWREESALLVNQSRSLASLVMTIPGFRHYIVQT